RVTLMSLLPCTTSTVRVSGCHPELDKETFTWCDPTRSSMCIGVTFRMSTPSTDTWAPDGKDVTLNSAPSACRSLQAPANNVKNKTEHTPRSSFAFPITVAAPFPAENKL